ncbi:MAG: RagB/SusD family nutrient uptake outer membrane protein [Muribaculaceae bacterium]|nr:RagB/SusD family nutrient uptake outer membrane protein [Muribaculaceae bacterium]
MKYSKYITGSAAALMGAALLTACSGILDEQPRSIYDPSFFKTEQGIDGGLTSLYAHLRMIYGNGYYFNICETGTDEFTYGQSADTNFKDADLSGVGSLTSSSSRSDVLWNNVFTYINTASGIIENAAEAGLAESKISEARFFRAFDYFNLVRTFGGVPLDFGSGELAFNDTPSRTSIRCTVPEVYTKAIFPDLLIAVNNLPAEPRMTGAVTKTVARKFLAEAYLTYAWWLENPNNIPTYPECSRVDPDGHDAAWYYQQAYNIAVDAISDPGPYGLVDTYYDLFYYENDRNKELLLYADHTTESAQYNGMYQSGSSWGYAGGTSPDNFAGWMANWNYPVMHLEANNKDEDINPVEREATQPLGRPWTRMAPCIGAIEKFDNKDKDSRFDGTFTLVYHGNWHYGSNPNVDFVYGYNDAPIYAGEVVARFLGDEPASGVTYPESGRQDKTGMGFGWCPDYKEYVRSPQGFSRICYPALYKLGMYPLETVSPEGKPQLGSPNGPISRPFNIARFAEFYFIAAEAAVKGANTRASYSARELINVVRARAGKWTHRVNGDREYWEEYEADYSSDLTASTPAQITIDYILDERMREFFGEGYRWFDLTRTQKWQEYAGTYRICGNNALDHTPETITRTIPDNYYLRPIPQGTIDSFEMTPEERTNYQNPAYR